MKPFYLLALAATLAFAGCKKDNSPNSPPTPEPEPELTVEQTDYTLDAFEERTATAAFTAKGDWSLSIVYDNAETDAAWLTADAAGGAAGEQSVGMSAARNFQTSPRTAYVDLVCGEQSVRLTVTQTGLSDDTNFSTLFDETFAQALQKQNIVADAEQITLQEMQSMAIMTELDISGTYDNPGSLTSLQGIEYFESLTSLWCQYNQLPSLGVSNNKELTKLYCQSNSLTELDVSRNTKLTVLSCNNNQLISLDVSKNTELTELPCAYNQLTKLDISNNTKLTSLRCYSNSLTSLDISQNTKLTSLLCHDNPGDGESKFPVTVWGGQRDQAGEFIYSLHELEVQRQDHYHRLPDGNGRIAPLRKGHLLVSKGTTKTSRKLLFAGNLGTPR